MVIKMDKIWIALATLIHPKTEQDYLISQAKIIRKVLELFDTSITPVMIEKHLVAFVDRMADKKNPKRGGSRNRYLFRTNDGKTPDSNGLYRLTKKQDREYDGMDKTGKLRPEGRDIGKEFQYLINWFDESYYP